MSRTPPTTSSLQESRTRPVPSLRIAVIAPSRYPVRQPYAGGLESMVGQLVGHLRERGHEVTFFAGEGSDHGDEEYAFPATPWDPSPVAAQDTSMPTVGFMRDHHSHLRLMMALAGPLAESFDVVHNHSLHHLPVAMASLVPTTVVTTLHTPPTPWLESAVQSAPHPQDLRFTAVSRYVARQWESLPTWDEPVVVANGVDLSAWTPGIGGGPLVWSGRLVPEKAPHLAIDAARRCGRSLVLAGPISDHVYFEQAVRPRLGRGVHYAGHLEIADLCALVGSATAVLVTPVWDEPYGLVVAEALACGTPVVAFARGGIPEVMGVAPRGDIPMGARSAPRRSPVGALVAPGDVAGMASAVEPVADVDRTAVRAFAERTVSIDRMVSRYERHYRHLLSGPTWEESRLA